MRRTPSSLVTRPTRVRPQAVVSDIESEMELLGATGVEDKLQGGVPETLETMRAAGIKVKLVEQSRLNLAKRNVSNVPAMKLHICMVRQMDFFGNTYKPAECYHNLFATDYPTDHQTCSVYLHSSLYRHSNLTV